jgi:hypothetical protein
VFEKIRLYFSTAKLGLTSKYLITVVTSTTRLEEIVTGLAFSICYRNIPIRTISIWNIVVLVSYHTIFLPVTFLTIAFLVLQKVGFYVSTANG